MAEDEEVILLVRLPGREMVKARRLLHAQPWYTGTDVPINADRDYFGLDTSPLFQKISKYFDSWKTRAGGR